MPELELDAAADAPATVSSPSSSSSEDPAVAVVVGVDVTVYTGLPVAFSAAKASNHERTSAGMDVYQAGVLPAWNSDSMLAWATGFMSSMRTEAGTAVMMAICRLDGTEMPSVSETLVYCALTGLAERNELLGGECVATIAILESEYHIYPHVFVTGVN